MVAFCLAGEWALVNCNLQLHDTIVCQSLMVVGMFFPATFLKVANTHESMLFGMAVGASIGHLVVDKLTRKQKSSLIPSENKV